MNGKRKPNRGRAFTRSMEEYDKLIREPWLAEMIDEVRRGNENVKGELPFRCAHYGGFKDDHRSQKDALPDTFLFQTTVDVDDKDMVETAMERAMTIDKDETSAWHGLLLNMELSAREKLHLDIRMPIGMTIEETQREYCKALGIPFDESCVTPERFIYIVDVRQVRYRHPDWYAVLPEEELKERRKAFERRGLGMDGRKVAPLPTAPSRPPRGEENLDSNEPSSSSPADVTKHSPLGGEGGASYRGYPFPSLIQKYIEMFCDGEEPCEGDTNVKTFEMARTFAPILAYSVEELKKVIPHYNSEARTTPFSYEEYVQCLQNAVGNEQKRGGMPYRLRQVLKAMDAEKGKATKIGKFLKTLPPEPPKRMCSLHRLLAENVHSEKHKAVIYDLNAPLLAHLHGVQLRATDNTLWTPSQMQILCARQSSGKGCVNEVIDAVMEDIQRSDDAMNQRLKAWKEKQRKEKTKSPRPQDIYRQILSYDTTNAALTQMNIDAYQNGQRSLYGKYNEIELLYKMRSTGKGIDDLLRINFDHDILSQGRVGTDSVDGGCPLHWNFNASTTPTGLLEFMKEKMIVNGTLSRLHLMTFIVEEGRQKQMTFGNYDEAWKARLKPYIDNLNNASGVVECPQANKVCQQLYDENDDMADMYESEAFRVIGYRAVKLAWARTMVLYIAEGYRWSRQLADYMRWSWQRDMWTKMYYVGDQVETLMNSEREIGGKGPQNLLSLLPDEFSEADYQQMRREQGKQGDGKSTLRTWKTRGYIDYDEVAKVWVKK